MRDVLHDPPPRTILYQGKAIPLVTHSDGVSATATRCFSCMFRPFVRECPIWGKRAQEYISGFHIRHAECIEAEHAYAITCEEKCIERKQVR